MAGKIVHLTLAGLLLAATSLATAVSLHTSDANLIPDLFADKVRVELYFEGLCPYCHKFITEQLIKTKDLGIVDYKLVPFGNAKETRLPDGAYTYTCQHGLAECDLNRLLGCAIDLNGALRSLPFVACLSHTGATTADAQSCAKKSGIDYATLHKCDTGARGQDVMHQNAEATANLEPPHKFVPWLVINGQHSDSIQSAAQADLVAYVCSLYHGKLPAGCPRPQYTLRD